MSPRRGPSNSTIQFVIPVFLVFAFCLGALAQTDRVSPGLVEAYRAAYRDLLRRPLDLDRLYRFAGLAEQVGEPRMAARALDRILLTNPALIPVRVRLGIVYYNLGELTLARAQLLKARADSAASPQVLATAEQYLAAIEGRTRRQELTGWLEAGVRYQTNGTAGPRDDRILFRGQPQEVPDGSRKADDQDIYALAYIKHAYRLEAERPTAWESTLDAYLFQRLEQQRLSYLSLVGTTGPRFGSAEAAATFRPHLVASYEGVHQTTYGGGVGLGLDGVWRLSPATLADFLVIGGYRLYNDTGRWGENSDHQGPNLAGSLGLTFSLRPRTALRLGLFAERQFAAKAAQANTRLGPELRLTQLFDAPWGVTSLPWSVSLAAQWTRRWHDEPDHDIDPDTERRDDLFRVYASTSIPMTRSWSLVVRGGMTRNASNIRNYQWDNYDLSAGLGVRF